MLQDGGHCAEPGANCSSAAQRRTFDIADQSLLAAITPCPAQGIVEQEERASRRQLGKRFRAIGWLRAQQRWFCDRSLERIGVMRGDHPPGERGVGKVGTIGVQARVGRIRGTGEREALTAGARRRPDR